ncbi:hypothetical protein ACQ4WX_37395 [Streptomyces lasalocidi]
MTTRARPLLGEEPGEGGDGLRTASAVQQQEGVTLAPLVDGEVDAEAAGAVGEGDGACGAGHGGLHIGCWRGWLVRPGRHA